MNIKDAKRYFEAMAKSLKRMSKSGDAFVFLCGSAVIEYLSKCAAGQDDGPKGFKKFVRDYMPDVYRNFRYASGAYDLPEQMYHILRCGIVHSFSLKADPRAKRSRGRDHSIALSHKAKEGHVKNISEWKAKDACCLNAYQFVDDIRKAVSKLFEDAENSSLLKKNIEHWLSQYPPIQGAPISQPRKHR